MRYEVQTVNICKTYRTDDGPVQALSAVDLAVAKGEFVSIVGPSGCGKSTLLKIVAGLIRSSSGSVTVNGAEVTSPQTQVGMVFQAPTLLRWRTALGNILLQAEAKHMDRTEAQRRALQLLETVGLRDFQDKLPHELSGGMQQRVAICRALLHDPTLMLMDEPFGALDAITRDEMSLQLGQLWVAAPRTMLFVTHSIPEAVFLGDRVVVMCARPGRVITHIGIDLPRPRQLDIQQTGAFNEYVGLIRHQLEQAR